MRLLIGGTVFLLAFAVAQPTSVLAQANMQSTQMVAIEKPAIPDAYRMDILIRTTLIALSQANRTGNYTVLRDLGSPAFHSSVSAARLTESFTNLRNRRIDFSPILFFTPKLIKQPTLDDAGRLRLTGFLETRPEQINFDMTFENVAGEWRLFGLSVQMQPIPAASADSNAAAKFAAPASKMRESVKNTSAPKKK